LIASVHLAAGSATALFVTSYSPLLVSNKSKVALALVAGIASHVILDTFPHQEYMERWPWLLVIAETIAILMFVLSAQYSITRNSVLFIGMAGAAIPDLFHISRGHLFRSLDVLHFFHGSLPSAFWMSMFWQSVITCLAIIYIKIKSA